MEVQVDYGLECENRDPATPRDILGLRFYSEKNHAVHNGSAG